MPEILSIGGSILIVLRISGYLLTIWILYFTILGFINCIAVRIELHHHPMSWLRRRGIDVSELTPNSLSVLWLKGSMPKTQYLKFAWIVAVMTPHHLVLEGQIPFRIRRSRVVLSRSTQLREVKGEMADLRRTWRVSSTPIDDLPHLLKERGWLVTAAKK